MKRLYLSFAVLLMLFFCEAPILFAQSPPPPPPPAASSPANETWKEYSYPTGGFAIKLPVEPNFAPDIPRTFGGKRRAVTLINCSGKGYFGMYSVRFATIASSETDASAIKKVMDDLQTEQLNIIKNNVGRIVTQQDISMAGNSGRFLHIEMKNKAVLRVKYFVVGQQLIQLEILTMSEDALTSSLAANAYEKPAMTFLNSFRVLEKSK